MKFYSEITNELYDTKEELLVAEAEHAKNTADIDKAKSEYEAAMTVAVKTFFEAFEKFNAYQDLLDDGECEELPCILEMLFADE